MSCHGHVTYHVILLVIILRHFTMSIFTYHFTLPTSQYTKPHLSIAIETPHWWESHPLVLPAVIPLQFRFLLTNILLLGLALSTSETIQELDYSMKSFNWRRHTKQNQPRMMLMWRTWLFFIKHCTLGTSVTRPKYINAGRNRVRLPGVYLTLLWEKLVALISL